MLSVPAGETVKLLPKDKSGRVVVVEEGNSSRANVWEFLEGRSPWGKVYERFSVLLILVNVLSFVIGSEFDKTYNVDPATGKYMGASCDWCDAAFFGNDVNNGLLGFSFLELFTVNCFTVDYVLRLWACVEDKTYPTRLSYLVSFFSLVDLVSTVPTYVNYFTSSDIAATQFLRMFRFFRIMRVEGRYAEAFTLFDDVIANKSHVMLTAGFVGSVVWIIVAGFYYVAEKGSLDMIYCPGCPDVDVTKCVIDFDGLADCTKAGCGGAGQCWNLFESIPASMFQTLLNLFGEFPLASRYSAWGMCVGGFTAAVAAVIFGIPCGIIGSGFQELLEKRRDEAPAAEDAPVAASASAAANYGAASSADAGRLPDGTPGASGLRGKAYGLFFGSDPNREHVEKVVTCLIVLSTLTFMFETSELVMSRPSLRYLCAGLELVTVFIFTVEYALRAYCIGVDPSGKYEGLPGLFRYLTSFFAVIDLLSIAPFYIGLSLHGALVQTMFMRSLRLLRILRTQQFNDAFSVLESVVLAQKDILIVTGFAALVFWVLFATLMYFTERDNLDAEMRGWYRTIPQSMWITLLNLSGECPVCMYTTSGKWILGIIGIFAVGFVSVPIGVLSAGFQDYAASNCSAGEAELPDDVDAHMPESTPMSPTGSGNGYLGRVRNFLEGRTASGAYFEVMVLILIFATVFLAAVETVPGLTCKVGDYNTTWCPVFKGFEAIAVLTFTVEYGLRVYAAQGERLSFVLSFYSLVDVAAIVPWYIAALHPGGWADQHNEIFLMLRILRILKLDKACPSLTLIDDVFRLQRAPLVVTGIVAVITLVFFNALMYLCEFGDVTNQIDPVPYMGCSENCTQSDRYSSAITSLPYVMVHLTGDYPIVDYNMGARIVCFLMVVAGAGLVGIPTGLIADGFGSLVEKRAGEGTAMRDYDFRLAKIGDEAPREFQDEKLDRLQRDVNSLLNGERGKNGSITRSLTSTILNAGILALVVVNVGAVLLESVPAYRETPLLDYFEAMVVGCFTVEYLLRVFSVTKDKAHLYSRYCYFTTFFGVVDLLAILPFYVELLLGSEDSADVFQLIRLFRLLQLERFITAFTVLDNVFWRSRGVLAATGLLALSIWLSASALFYMFEEGNPNWCAAWADEHCATEWIPSCVCTQKTTFNTMPHAMFFTAVFLAGEWAVIDFTVPGKLLCVFLCVVGIALAALPVGTLFDSFGNVLDGGLTALDEEDDGDGGERG